MIRSVSEMIENMKMVSEKYGEVTFKPVYGDSVSKDTILTIRIRNKNKKHVP